MSKADLRLDWCSYQAAKWAVEHWHYSHRMPRSKMARIGVWESDQFKGVVIFSYGATPEIGSPYNLKQTEIVELTRVALTDHSFSVSRVLSIAVKILKREYRGLRLIVSFADTSEGHHGGIYQASDWLYVGCEEYHAYRVLGKVEHPRTLYDRYGVGGQSIPWLRAHVDPMAERLHTLAKHKYLYPLDPAMRAQIEPLRKPYPKRERGETDSAARTNAQTDGARPIRSLLSVDNGTP